WLSVVVPEEPDGVELVLHLADEPARAFQRASWALGRPVISLRSDAWGSGGPAGSWAGRSSRCVPTIVSPRPSGSRPGGGVRQGTLKDGLRWHGCGLCRELRQPAQPPPGLTDPSQACRSGPGPADWISAARGSRGTNLPSAGDDAAPGRLPASPQRYTDQPEEATMDNDDDAKRRWRGGETALGGLLVLLWILVQAGQAVDVEVGQVGWPFFVIVPGLGLLGLGLAADGRVGGGRGRGGG